MATDPRIHALRMGEYNIPKRLRHLRLHTSDAPASEASRDFVDNLRDHYVTDKRPLNEYPENWHLIGQGIAFVGPPGTGKTTLAVSTLLEVYYTRRLPVFFLPYAEYVDLSIEQMSLSDRNEPEANARWWEIQNILHSTKTAPVLLLDDVSKEHKSRKSDYAQDCLDTLLRYRHREGQPTLITTNLPLSKWGEAYNPSMGSFVKEAFQTLLMVGEDRRGAR
jgi:DNA replication protein DnaC